MFREQPDVPQPFRQRAGRFEMFILRRVAGFKLHDENARAGGLQLGVKFRRQEFPNRR